MPLLDCEHQVDLIRLVRGDRGRVRMRVELIMRFDYGRGIPWAQSGGRIGVSASLHAAHMIDPTCAQTRQRCGNRRSSTIARR